MDVIGVAGTEDKLGSKTLLKITHVRVALGQQLLDDCKKIRD